MSAAARTLPAAAHDAAAVVRVCSVNGCERPHVAKGYCNAHYLRAKKGSPLDTPLQVYRTKVHSTDCSVDGCERARSSQGMCHFHYQRRRLGVPFDQPARAPRGARRVEHDGYVTVYHPDHPNATSKGRVMEHRFVMAEHLGRPLAPGETVHHRDGNRQNNHISNLELWSRAQPAGQRVEDLLAFWVEQVRRYAPHLLRDEPPARGRSAATAPKRPPRATARTARHGRGQGAARGASRRVAA